MSGIVRNILTFIIALLSRSRFNSNAMVDSYFFITPFDCGISVLKSDKYFQLAESAQVDFLVKTKLFNKLKQEELSFVNASQLVKFIKPIHVFTRVRVESKIVYTDDKCAYFSHALYVGSQQHGEVLVKMKFKKGSLTIKPADIVGVVEPEHKHYLELWNQALNAM